MPTAPRGWWWSVPGSVGLGAGVKLRRAGIDTFTIYESSTGVGGAWWDNTYPGAEVDVDSNLCHYSFKPHRWPRSHAGQPELHGPPAGQRRRGEARVRVPLGCLAAAPDGGNLVRAARPAPVLPGDPMTARPSLVP